MIEVGEKYIHYKHPDREYEILTIAKHSESGEDVVVYKALYGEGQIWARPLEMFLEEVEINGQKVKRFRKRSNGFKIKG